MKAKRSLIIIMVALSMAFVIITQAHASYKGKVVDADTGKPIEGAVVLMYWYRGCLPYGNEEFFDASETLTDNTGMFEIKGPKVNLNILCRVDNPHFIIFKGGYKPIKLAWVISVFKEDRMKKWLSFDSDLVVFKFNKLSTIEERKRNLTGVGSAIPYEKRKSFMKELNKERINLGLDPVTR